MRLWARSLLAAAVVVVGLGSAAAAAAWALNPQPLPPRVLGVVRDACTGLPLAGASVSLTAAPGTAGGINPGPIQTGPLGVFSTSVQPGVYLLGVSAPGYASVGLPGGADPGPVQVTADPGPISLPAGEAVNETLVGAIALVPATPGAACAVNPGPQQVPALTVLVRNGSTGLPILGASGTLTPTAGEANPGPQQFGLLGLFGWNTLAAGDYTLTIAAPRYRDPGPIQVTKDPGPMQFGDGSSVGFGEALDIQLAP